MKNLTKCFLVVLSLLFYYNTQGQFAAVNASISNVNFYLQGDRIVIKYTLNSKSPNDKFFVTITPYIGLGSQAQRVNQANITGNLTGLSSGEHEASWAFRKDVEKLNDQMYVVVSANVVPYINTKTAIVKTAIFPGLGQRDFNKKNRYYLNGILTYAALGGAVLTSIMANDSYNSYTQAQSSSDIIYYDDAVMYQTISAGLAGTAALLWTSNMISVTSKAAKYKRTNTGAVELSRYPTITAQYKPKHIDGRDTYQKNIDKADSLIVGKRINNIENESILNTALSLYKTALNERTGDKYAKNQIEIIETELQIRQKLAESERIERQRRIKDSLQKVERKELQSLRADAIVFYSQELRQDKEASQYYGEQGEFEPDNLYNDRMAKLDSVYKELTWFYTQKYKDYLEQLEIKRQTDIRNSYSQITFAFDSIAVFGTYDPNKQMMPVTIGNQTLRLPISIAEAQTLKPNAARTQIIADIQYPCNLQQNKIGNTNYLDTVNIKIIHPITGTPYEFGEQRDPCYLNIAGQGTIVNIPLEGFPKLATTVKFVEVAGDYIGNNILDAQESGKIIITISNSGDGWASNIVMNVSTNEVSYLKYLEKIYISHIAPGETEVKEISINAERHIATQEVAFNIDFTEARGFQPDPIRVRINTFEFRQPKITLVQAAIDDKNNKDGRIDRVESIEVTAFIQNQGQGIAKDVKVIFQNGDNNIIVTNPALSTQMLGDMKANEVREVKYEFLVNNNYKGDNLLPIQIIVSEKENNPQWGINQNLGLELNKKIISATDVIITGTIDTVATDKRTARSDVEENIPKTNINNASAIALVISVDNYKSPSIPTVEYADYDAQTIRKYLVDIMGYRPENIFPQDLNEEMSAGTLKTLIKSDIKSALKPDGSSDLFVYFVGHGIPNVNGMEAYFATWDTDFSNPNDYNSYKMTEFYDDIMKLNAKQKIVVVDACFSGTAGNGKTLIQNASPLIRDVNTNISTDPKSVVLQAAKSDQVANWYPEKYHSMFTYFFLKGIKGEADLNGDKQITLQELNNFINDENDGLPYWSHRKFKRKQESPITGNPNTIIVRFD